MWHPNIEFLCVASLFQMIPNCHMVDSSCIGYLLTAHMSVFSTSCKISSIFSVTGWSERGRSLTSKFPERNRTHHTCVLRSLTVFRAVNFINFSACFCCVFAFFVIKKHHIAYFFRNFTHFQINIIFDTIDELSNFVYKKCNLKCHLSDARSFDTIGLVLLDIWPSTPSSDKKPQILFKWPNIKKLIEENERKKREAEEQSMRAMKFAFYSNSVYYSWATIETKIP